MNSSSTNEYSKPEELKQEELAGFIIDMFHRMMVHHTLWFREVEHQLGMEKSLGVMGAASKKANDIQMKRLGKALGFEVKDGIPAPLLNMPREKLLSLASDIGKNWLAMDGLWFQTVESAYGMNDAKRCNDSTWVRFSPFEAWSIKRLLGLPKYAELDGLKKALFFRMYSRINKQSIVDESPNSIVFQMNDCRVQSARKRRGLADYPCKSAGLVEYSRFAEAIDPRIKTECIGCPPDAHPDEWFCAWRFYIAKD